MKDIKNLKAELHRDTKTPIQTTFEQKGDSAKLDMVTERRVKTLEDLIRVAEIDTEVWEIERFTCNKWEVASSSKTKDGTVTGFTVQDLWQVKATMKKRVDAIALKEVGRIILDEIRSTSVKVPKMPSKKYSDPCLFEADLFDAHIGQLVWGLESGENYDLKIARETYLTAIKKLIERVSPYNIERILFPIGNDYYNVNGGDSMTYAGTLQHEDARWKKTFKMGCGILFESIEMLSKVAPVDVVTVVGNHDKDAAFFAGEVVDAKFCNDKNISVDNSPSQRKYYRYGKCLIGLTHGKEEKVADLPLIMANEQKQNWNETKFREWHIGHVHHKKEYKYLSSEEFKGVTIRVLRALTATDAWHNEKGYIGSLRAAEGFIWNKNEGLICNLSVNI